MSGILWNLGVFCVLVKITIFEEQKNFHETLHSPRA
ncbi:MAG: hypothetical protein RLZZ262_1673, partial [Bacteroidota bacterium]